MTDEVVTRLYRCLVEELDERGHAEGRPLKVSELYQDLVPYRSVRSALGVELNADYEHALLRLLSGERDLLRLEPPQAREELRREVEAPYPFVGLFRKFSASNVWVNRPEIQNGEGASGRARTREDDAGDGNAAAPPPGQAAQGSQPSVPPADQAAPAPAADADAQPTDAADRVAAEGDTVPLRARRHGALAPARAPVQLHRERHSPADRLEVGGVCPFCSDELPGGRRIRYCPHCGGDQRMRPCPRCEAVLERTWRYCISCGQEPDAND